MMLRRGAYLLSIWSAINFLLAFLILSSVVVFQADSPLLGMVFEKSEIASLDSRVIAALNTLTILYNSCSMVVSIFVWLVIQKNLLAGQKWAFWLLLVLVGFIEIMAWIASAGVGNARWQVNLIQSVLYVVGIILAGCGFSRHIVNYSKTKHARQVKTLFQAIYPEWDESMLERMAYDENHPAHLQTKLVVENSNAIGQANVFWLDPKKRIANLGYHIHPAYQRQGLGLQLAQALIDDLTSQVDCFVVLTTEDNCASQKLCQKLGFTQPTDEIRAAVTGMDKYQKISNPYLRVMMVNQPNR